MPMDYNLLNEMIRKQREELLNISGKEPSPIEKIIQREKERREELARRAREERDYRIRGGFMNGYR